MASAVLVTQNPHCLCCTPSRYGSFSERVRNILFMATLFALVGCERDVTPEVADVAPARREERAAPSAISSVSAPRDGFYMGRQLAQTMSHEGAPWLVREERDEEENPDLMVEKLALAPGQVACDVGAGNGFHSLRLAKIVGQDGRVLAVDIQTEMLAMLKKRAKAAGIENIETIVGAPADPRLPDRVCDIVLMVDVYHELSDPPAMLAKLKAALTPTGRVALVEFREEDPDVPIKPLHKMSKAQMTREMAANGLVVDRSFDGLPWQHLMLFRRR